MATLLLPQGAGIGGVRTAQGVRRLPRSLASLREVALCPPPERGTPLGDWRIGEVLLGDPRYAATIAHIERSQHALRRFAVEVAQPGSQGELMYSWRVSPQGLSTLTLHPACLSTPEMFQATMDAAWDTRSRRDNTLRMVESLIGGLKLCPLSPTGNHAVDSLVAWLYSRSRHETTPEQVAAWIAAAFGFEPGRVARLLQLFLFSTVWRH